MLLFNRTEFSRIIASHGRFPRTCRCSFQPSAITPSPYRRFAKRRPDLRKALLGISRAFSNLGDQQPVSGKRERIPASHSQTSAHRHPIWEMAARHRETTTRIHETPCHYLQPSSRCQKASRRSPEMSAQWSESPSQSQRITDRQAGTSASYHSITAQYHKLLPVIAPTFPATILKQSF